MREFGRVHLSCAVPIRILACYIPLSPHRRYEVAVLMIVWKSYEKKDGLLDARGGGGGGGRGRRKGC